MAGTKGHSGGSRTGTGGSRVGAGRKKENPTAEIEYSVMESADRPLDFLVGIMNDQQQKPEFRLRAAITAAQYSHNKVGDSGKKDEKLLAAGKASGGRFQSGAPPLKIISIKRKPNEKT